MNITPTLRAVGQILLLLVLLIGAWAAVGALVGVAIKSAQIVLEIL